MQPHSQFILPHNNRSATIARANARPLVGSFGRLAVGVAVTVVLMSMAAQVRIPLPFTPVPMTLQSLVVLLAGFALPPVAAAIAMVVYLAVGAAGAPVFASPAGLAGLTGGYLMAFPIVAAAVSWVRGNGRVSFARLLLAGSCGLAILFACGIGWATLQLGGWSAAAKMGLLPFLPKAMVELGLAAMAASVWQSLRRHG